MNSLKFGIVFSITIYNDLLHEPSESSTKANLSLFYSLIFLIHPPTESILSKNEVGFSKIVLILSNPERIQGVLVNLEATIPSFSIL